MHKCKHIIVITALMCVLFLALTTGCGKSEKIDPLAIAPDIPGRWDMPPEEMKAYLEELGFAMEMQKDRDGAITVKTVTHPTKLQGLMYRYNTKGILYMVGLLDTITVAGRAEFDNWMAEFEADARAYMDKPRTLIKELPESEYAWYSVHKVIKDDRRAVHFVFTYLKEGHLLANIIQYNPETVWPGNLWRDARDTGFTEVK